MARSGFPEDGLYTFMMSAGAAERVVRYRQDAENFRQMAQRETDETFRETLLVIAKEYDDLADHLIAPERGGVSVP